MDEHHVKALVVAVTVAFCAHPELLVSVDAQASITGGEFYLAFMEHWVCYSSQLTLFITNPGTTIVKARLTVHISETEETSQSVSVAAGNMVTVTLPSSLLLEGSGRHEKHVHISALHPFLVQSSVRCMDDEASSSVGFTVLPRSALTANYIVATHCPINQCLVVVTSVENNNDVTIHLKLTSGMTVKYDGTLYGDGDQIFESLSQGQSIQLAAEEADMTGTWVSASKDVAVFSGGDRASLNLTLIQKDAIGEQMQPLESLGRSYLLEPPDSTPDVVKVVLLHAGDHFTYGGMFRLVATEDREVFVIGRSQSTEPMILEGSCRMLVVRVGRMDNPDLVMNLPVPRHLWGTDYTLGVPDVDRRSSSMENVRMALTVRTGDLERLEISTAFVSHVVVV